MSVRKARRKNSSVSTSRPDWTILHSEIVIETPYLRLRRDRIRLPSGAEIDDYFVREARGFSVIFALTGDGRVVLVRQYKHGVATSVLELPAGALEPGETPAACALRELAEETGFVADPDDLELVRTFMTDPTNSDGRFHLFIARNARLEREPAPDPTEQIAVEFASLDQLRDFVAHGTIEVGHHVAAIYTVLEHLGRLGRA